MATAEARRPSWDGGPLPVGGQVERGDAVAEFFFFMGGSVSIAADQDVVPGLRFVIATPEAKLEVPAPATLMRFALADPVGRSDAVVQADPVATRLVGAGATAFGGTASTGVADPIAMRLSTPGATATMTDVASRAQTAAMRIITAGATATGQKNVTAQADCATMQFAKPPSPNAFGLITSGRPGPGALSGLSGIEVLSWGKRPITRK
jgi:hypothetical protein